MSGGVDSAVSAGLLKQAGCEVIGVFIKVWEPAGFVCNWRAERREARRVAAHLDIPLLTLDLSKEYKQRVVDYFIAEYKIGRTPNPDVMCNKQIKFGAFYDWALAHDADYVATGHYAIVAQQKTGLPSHGHKGEFETKPVSCLAISKDLNKDQTYFLWNLKSEQLTKILFPIGQYTKPQVRALAKKFGLPNAEKKDSQGLCFIGRIDFKDFLKNELKSKSGAVLSEQGEIIGQHDGAIFFTLGERHGFEIFTKTPAEKPYYITAKDIAKNTITVSQNSHSFQAEKLEVKIEKTNWLSETRNDFDREFPVMAVSRQNHFLLSARIRYRQPLQKCQLKEIDQTKSTAIIIFDQPQLAVPGQSLVLYGTKGLICLGGGVIV